MVSEEHLNIFLEMIIIRDLNDLQNTMLFRDRKRKGCIYSWTACNDYQLCSGVEPWQKSHIRPNRRDISLWRQSVCTPVIHSDTWNDRLLCECSVV